MFTLGFNDERGEQWCRDIRREGPRTGAVHKLVQKFELLTDEYVWEVDYYHKDLPILCKPLFQKCRKTYETETKLYCTFEGDFEPMIPYLTILTGIVEINVFWPTWVHIKTQCIWNNHLMEEWPKTGSLELRVHFFFLQLYHDLIDLDIYIRIEF